MVEMSPTPLTLPLTLGVNRTCDLFYDVALCSGVDQAHSLAHSCNLLLKEYDNGQRLSLPLSGFVK